MKAAVSYRWLAIQNRLLAPSLNLVPQHEPLPLTVPSHYNPTQAPDNSITISIVTPVLNGVGFIGDTIHSVRQQRHASLEYLEYIVQDGASTDGTPEALAEFRDLLQLYSEPDNGQSQALNRGFARTSGEIMAYLNADDLLLPGSLSYVATYFNDHPGVDAVYGHRVLIDANGDEIGRWVLPPHDDTILPYADYIPQETLFWRRSLWDKVGGCFREDLHYTMDWDLLLRFVGVGANIVRLPRFLGAFRVHPGQKTGNLDAETEMMILRQATLGVDSITYSEIHRALRGYMLRHILYQKLYRLGVLRH